MRRIWMICVVWLASYYYSSAQQYAEILERYKNENAVMLQVSEHLTISWENGKLTAKSNIEQDRMLISGAAVGLYNKDYIFHSYFNRLEEYDAYVLMPGKNGYKKNKDYISRTNPSPSNNIFYDDGKQTELLFSGLAPAAILHTEHTISHTDLHMLPAYYFQENIPVVQTTYVVTAPKSVTLKFVLKGADTNQIIRAISNNKNTTTYTFTAAAMPAYKELDDVPSASYYLPHVIPIIQSYVQPKTDEKIELGSSVDALYQYFYNYIKDINIKEDEQIAATVATITKGDNTDEEKAAHIYKWVQDNMHYIAFEDSLEGFIPRQASQVLQRKFGDCKDMGSILCAMCRKAGMEAYLTWIGTRQKPYTWHETPLPMVANHMICAIRLKGKWIFLDGTDPINPFGENPAGIQGKQALIAMNNKKYEIVTVPETPATTNTTNDTTIMQVEGKNLKGTVTVQYSGYPAWDLISLLVYYKNEDRDKMIKAYTTRGTNKYVQISNKYTHEETGKKAARLQSEFSIDDYVPSAGNEWYINMNLKRNYETARIDTAKRRTPYFFKYRAKEVEVVELAIPDGFKATYIPPDAKGHAGTAWEYKITYSATPTKVRLIKEYVLNTMQIDQVLFLEHNKTVEELRGHYKESVVLSRQ